MKKSENLKILKSSKNTKYPSSLDWRDKNVVSPVRNQFAVACGSCYIHSALSAIESKYFIDSGNDNSLSDQQILDCDPSNTCAGGDPNEIPKYIGMIGKVCSFNDYHWVGKKEECKLSKCKTIYELPEYEFVDIAQSESALMDAVQQQPILVTMSDELLKDYVGGVITDKCDGTINHATLVVGYGKENGTDYWLIKNSYGEDWGEKGFFKLQRNSGDKYGKCQVAGGASLTSLKQSSKNKGGMNGGEVFLEIVVPIVLGLCLIIFVYYYFFKCYGCRKVYHESSGTRVKSNKDRKLDEI